MKLQLRTISPIHIGTGEELAPLDYVVYDKTFYRISQEQLFKLTYDLLPESGVQNLGDWVSEQYYGMKDITDNRELSAMNNKMNAYYFFQSQNKGRELVSAMTSGRYGISGTSVTLDNNTLNRYRNERVAPLGQVRTAMKNPQGVPYIPGSSLKGSLRTALLLHYLMNHADKSKVEKSILEQLNRREKKERFGLPVVQSAFYCEIQDGQRNRRITDDEKMDLLKLVRITDAKMQQSDNSLHLAKMNIYLVEKKFSKDRNSAAVFEATQQPQASYCEIITSGQIIETDLDFDIDFLVQARRLLKDGGIRSGSDTVWIGLEEKVRQLFGLELRTLDESNKEQKKEEVIRHLLSCWADFSRRQIAAHQSWLEHFRKNDPRGNLSEKIEKGMRPVFGRANSSLIHMGFATGFQGMTAILYFLEDKRLEVLYKRVLEQFGIGNKPGNKGTYKVNMERFPKSRRLLEINDVIYPLGWLQWLDGTEPEEPLAAESTSTATVTPAAVEKPPVEPQFFKGQINYQKPPELDAVVIASGRPNKVKVYISPDNMPEMPLNGYSGPLEVGTVVVVKCSVNKKGEVLQVSFGRRK